MDFKQYQFKSFIYEALEELKFTEPTPIQKEIIPLIMSHKNVIGQSETGSGKTHAFLLPIFNQIEPALNQVQVIITSPTRELAKQLYDNVMQINSHSKVPFKVRLYVGGRDRDKELEWLEHNQPDIVIGTPGRIWDLAIKEKKLLIYLSKIFVIDEADMTLETGFLEEIDNIAGTMPKNLQMYVFSATIPEQLKQFLRKYMENPEIINLARFNATPSKLKHFLIPTKSREKTTLLLRLMNRLNPYLAIIFANTKKEVSELVQFLRENNFKVGEVHGDLASRERTRMMREIRDLKYTYVVATDIAARGIDIEGVSHIINYSLPDDYEFYIHRAGRTSRANLSGEVYSLYEREDYDYLNRLESKQIHFDYIDVKNDKIIEIKDRNHRKIFLDKVKIETQISTKKAGKIKPNYKRKLKKMIDKQKINKKR